jgi:hypothetical protein
VPAVDPAIYGIETDEHDDVHAAAARGIASPTTTLPHYDRIQQAFGGHDLSAIQAHVGGSSASDMGAKAYAAGSHVVFDREPDLHTAAHEAAHVIQQARGVNLYGGVGEAGDSYERAADAVADRVVAGESAEDLLGAPIGLSASPTAVQRKEDTVSSLSMRADGNRAHVVAAHLRLAAMTINTSCDEVDAAIAGGPVKNAQNVLDTVIKPAFKNANDATRPLADVFTDISRLGFKDNAIRAALGIFNKAKIRFHNLQGPANNWVSFNKLTATGLDSKAVERTANQFGSHLGVVTNGPGAVSGTEDPKVTSDDLVKEALVESLSAVENSVNAVADAMREDDPKTTVPPLASRVQADVSLLNQSIPSHNVRVSAATLKRVALISSKMRQAVRDGTTYGLDKHLIGAQGQLQIASQTINALPKKP